jgi:hypothetical protein
MSLNRITLDEYITKRKTENPELSDVSITEEWEHGDAETIYRNAERSIMLKREEAKEEYYKESYSTEKIINVFATISLICCIIYAFAVSPLNSIIMIIGIILMLSIYIIGRAVGVKKGHYDGIAFEQLWSEDKIQSKIEDERNKKIKELNETK